MRKSVAKLLLSSIFLFALVVTPSWSKEKTKSFDPLAGPDPQWPPAPDKPRLKWVALYRDEYDVGAQKKSRFIDVLSGAKRKVLAFQRPVSVAADDAGNIFVADFHQGIIAINTEAKTMKLFQGVRYKQITGVAADPNFVYVSDAAQKQIFILDKQGNKLGTLGRQGELNHPCGLALSKDGKTLWVADSSKHEVVGFDLATKSVKKIIGKRGEKAGELNFPVALAVMSNENVVVADFGNFRIQIFDSQGRSLKTFGIAGDKPGCFFRLKGIGIDPEDHIYALDGAFDNIQVFDRTGQLLTLFGEGGQRKGQFSLPAGLFFKGDLLYIADQWNNRIQVIRYLPETKTGEGQGTGGK